jgi:hypothetical protein
VLPVPPSLSPSPSLCSTPFTRANLLVVQIDSLYSAVDPIRRETQARYNFWRNSQVLRGKWCVQRVAFPMFCCDGECGLSGGGDAPELMASGKSEAGWGG